MVSSALVSTGITFVCAFQIHFLSVAGPYIYLNLLSYFPSPEIATCIDMYVCFSLSRIVMSGSLLGMVL